MKTIVNYIDLGVHYGYEIDLLLQQYQAHLNEYDLRIYGIEANTIIANALKDKYSEYTDIVQIFNYAVTDKDNETVKLFLTHDDTKLGSSIYASKNNVSNEYIETSTCKLSTFISKYIPDFNDAVNILKLNIEGAELLVYQDLINTNLQNKFKLYCGHPSHDIEKVPELFDVRKTYYDIIEQYNFNLKYFCADTATSINKCINIFDTLK
jgi:FkbM family methyltransferase